MCDLHLGVLYGSLDFKCCIQTGIEDNSSGIPQNCKSTSDSQMGAVNRNSFVVFLKAAMESIGFCDLQLFRFKMLLK